VIVHEKSHRVGEIPFTGFPESLENLSMKGEPVQDIFAALAARRESIGTR